MEVFRVEKNKGYTVMSNHHLRNKELSLKAKGLLSQMLSLPEDWDYTLAGLSLINREKIDAIREAVRELENAGYIQRSRERDEKGRLRGTTYVIYEQPPMLDLPTLEKPTLDNPTLEKPMLEKPTLENPTQLNKEIQKTNLPKKEKLNTDISSTHSIPFHSLNPSPLEDAAQPPERKRTEATDAYSVYEEIIKDNIEYDYLIQDRYLDRDRIEEILALILETVCTKRKTIRIAGDDYPAELQKAMKALLAQMKKQHDRQKIPHGKQTLKQLMKQNAGVSNIEITKDNIKAFESTAKKYGIDFALKKDSTEIPPRYLVFFKGRDADALTAAFKEFSAKKLTQEQKPSIRKLIVSLKEKAAALNAQRDKVKNKDRGIAR